MDRQHTEAPSEDRITGEIIGGAIDVHRELGPGLLESAYEQCLCHELSLRGVRFERQVPLPVPYKGIRLDCGYRMDLVVEGIVVVELKTVGSSMEAPSRSTSPINGLLFLGRS